MRAAAPMDIHLLPSSSRVTPEQLTAVFAAGVTACDFYVVGAEEGQDVPGGYQIGAILNVDHHAPTPRMTRFVSTTNLAIERFAESGRPEPPIVVNHTDCDSVLSAGILSGRLDPRVEYGAAALAADHTGDAHPIADLLQALDVHRDLALSFDSLRRRLAGAPLGPDAADALPHRLWKRDAAARAVASGRVVVSGRLAFGALDHPLDSEFFPALLPAAAVILLASRRSPSSPWAMKLRLGMAAPADLSLHDLHIHDMDPAYGGRWNAGSNTRGGGTRLEPDVYAAGIQRRLSALGLG
jgi:hypothetical protein